MTDIRPNLSALNLTLLQTLTNMQSQYIDYKNKGGQLRDQNSALQEEVRTLEAKHASLQAVADTYDREFLDRGQLGEPSFWSRRGFNTFQDWLLGAFFLIYAIVCLAILTYTVLYSTKKLQGAAIVLGVSIVLGIMMTGVIARFA